MNKQMIDDAKKMLRLMGMPVIEAKEEAEAQCCELVLNDRAYAVGSEDMDCLTFGAKILIRSKLQIYIKMLTTGQDSSLQAKSQSRKSCWKMY